MTDLDLSPLQAILAEFAPQGRTALLPALHAAQAHYGYLPEPVAAEVARTLHVPLADVFGVIDFYSLFYSEPVGKTMVHVCGDPACAMAGADSLFKVMSQREVISKGTVKTITVERAPCLGLCELAPAMMVQGRSVGKASDKTWESLLEETGRSYHTVLGGDIHLLTAHCARGHTTTLAEYQADGGYQGLQKALNLSPHAVIAEVKASGLVGRGGAAFPTAVKWEGTANAAAEPKYLVCNADEAEPGTFKDRVMMEDDPHRVLKVLSLPPMLLAHIKAICISGVST